MPTPFTSLRQEQVQFLLDRITHGDCCAIYGLSNTGKSLLLRGLASRPARPPQAGRRPATLVYVDCNRAVELTSQGFYEVVVRSVLEALSSMEVCPDPLLHRLHERHNQITSASVFRASLAFNEALSETCGQLGDDVVLLFDEFDEVYAALDNRALLNLRALKDKFDRALSFQTATVHPLLECRQPGDNEFAELFALHSLPLGMLSPEDSRRVVEELAAGRSPLAPEVARAIQQLAGGHLGLLTALTQTALHDQAADLSGDPNVLVECVKLWNQLAPEAQAGLKSLVTEPQAGLAPAMQTWLRTLGVTDDAGRIFSDLFAGFVRRQTDAPSQNGVGITVDEDAGEVWVDGVKITVLTDLEYRLMRLLHSRQDRLTTKEMIVEAVWGGQYLDSVDDARIEKLVSRLRAKVEPDPARPRYLVTQRGRGYKLTSRPVDERAEEGE